ncbi:hypothetical protein ACJMK2_036904 [Sinanodonta woodiana]|uniref:MATH domain-containing protein n=1 Tax=Sinanodonta woodiana TaxID=1069815 RepID=A0ABD3WIM0_SINWO
MSSEEKISLPTQNEGKVRHALCTYRQSGCNVILAKEHMSEHTRSCPFRRATTQTDDTSCVQTSSQTYTECQFESIGCDFRGTDTELLEHEKTSLQSHSNLLLLFGLKTDLTALEAHTELQSVSSDLRHKIHQYIVRLRNSQDDFQADHIMLTSLMEQITVVKRNLQVNNEHAHARIAATEANLRRNDEQIVALQRQLEEISDSNVVLRYRVGVLEDFVFEHLTRFCPPALAMQMIAAPIQYGVHGMGCNIMEICNFADKKRQAMTNRNLALISDPFITLNSVRMKLKVFLNGDEVKGETCMTVYVVIVRGLDDAKLNWPFTGKFTLYAFDPESSNYTFVDSFDADPSHFSFQKPSTDRNIGYGFLRSIRHSELERLIKEDKLVIKVTVMVV